MSFDDFVIKASIIPAGENNTDHIAAIKPIAEIYDIEEFRKIFDEKRSMIRKFLSLVQRIHLYII